MRVGVSTWARVSVRLRVCLRTCVFVCLLVGFWTVLNPIGGNPIRRVCICMLISDHHRDVYLDYGSWKPLVRSWSAFFMWYACSMILWVLIMFVWIRLFFFWKCLLRQKEHFLSDIVQNFETRLCCLILLWKALVLSPPLVDFWVASMMILDLSWTLNFWFGNLVNTRRRSLKAYPVPFGIISSNLFPLWHDVAQDIDLA